MNPVPLSVLLESGLLFEINRRVLHPFGLALTLEFKDEEGVKKGEVLKVSLLEDKDPEGTVFANETFTDGTAKYEVFLNAGGRTRLEHRAEKLGFIVQAQLADPEE